MAKKVILVSIDGMRPDGFLQCGNPFCKTMMTDWAYTLTAKTVFPSVTLPCHMSMFHSVPPERHGITTNLYMPPVRPIDGIAEVFKQAKKKNAIFYGWEPLRDICRPGTMKHAVYHNALAHEDTDRRLTEEAVDYIKKEAPDFVFLYMVETDEKGGHDAGWMSEKYLHHIAVAIDCVKRVSEEFPDYEIVVTADHGGHDRCHGTDKPEDMTIPMFFKTNRLEAGKELTNVSILDIAPTVVALADLEPAPEWEGKSLV